MDVREFSTLSSILELFFYLKLPPFCVNIFYPSLNHTFSLLYSSPLFIYSPNLSIHLICHTCLIFAGMAYFSYEIPPPRPPNSPPPLISSFSFVPNRFNPPPSSFHFCPLPFASLYVKTHLGCCDWFPRLGILIELLLEVKFVISYPNVW
jgi:hypothetical protein